MKEDSDYLFFGITRKKVDKARFNNKGSSSMVLWQPSTGDLYRHGNKEGPFRCEPIRAGDVVGVRLDMQAKTLGFTLNGRSLGPAFTGLSDRHAYYPCVAMCEGSWRVRLVMHAACGPIGSKTVPRPHLPALLPPPTAQPHNHTTAGGQLLLAYARGGKPGALRGNHGWKRHRGQHQHRDALGCRLGRARRIQGHAIGHRATPRAGTRASASTRSRTSRTNGTLAHGPVGLPCVHTPE